MSDQRVVMAETGDARGYERERTFATPVEEYHLHLDLDAWEDLYVVGDVHGCYDRLQALLDELDPSDDDLVVFVGDLIRKGPDSRKVVEQVRDTPNFVSARGNNEQKVIDGEKDIPDLYPVENVIHNLPVVITWEGGMVVHGGLDVRHESEDLSVDSLLNTRAIPPENGYDGPFWWEQFEGPETVFFGHTPLSAPVETDHAIGLDTGCVYGGTLTAYDWYAEEFVVVDGHEHESRPDEKFVDPQE